jgi:hypothetical protein
VYTGDYTYLSGATAGSGAVAASTSALLLPLPLLLLLLLSVLLVLVLMSTVVQMVVPTVCLCGSWRVTCCCTLLAADVTAACLCSTAAVTGYSSCMSNSLHTGKAACEHYDTVMHCQHAWCAWTCAYMKHVLSMCALSTVSTITWRRAQCSMTLASASSRRLCN